MARDSNEWQQGIRVVRVCAKRNVRSLRRTLRTMAKPGGPLDKARIVLRHWAESARALLRDLPQRLGALSRGSRDKRPDRPRKVASSVDPAEARRALGEEALRFEATEVAARNRRRVTSHDKELARQVMIGITAERSFEKSTQGVQERTVKKGRPERWRPPDDKKR